MKRIFNFLHNNWFKIIISFVVLLAGFSIFYYFVIFIPEKEWQMIYEQEQEKIEKEVQSKKEYNASRRKECLDIYQVEGKKYNNTRSWNYNDITDKCEITYNDSKKKTEEQCKADYGKSIEGITMDSLKKLILADYLNCLDGTFTNSF